MESLLKQGIPSDKGYKQVDWDEEESLDADTLRAVHVKRSNRWLYACIAFLAAGWSGTAAYTYYTRHQTNGLLHVYSNSPIPKEVFKPVKKTFHKDERYVGWSSEVNRNWDGLVAGHDAVWIENPQQWGLPSGQPAPFIHPNTQEHKSHNFYVVSSLHSLHCLNMIRFRYFAAVNKGKDSGVVDGADYTSKHWDVHIEHCFEYMRQSIACGGDLVLEGASRVVLDGKQVTSVTGWGVEHDCIDFDYLWNFVNNQEIKYNQTWQNP